MTIEEARNIKTGDMTLKNNGDRFFIRVVHGSLTNIIGIHVGLHFLDANNNSLYTPYRLFTEKNWVHRESVQHTKLSDAEVAILKL